MFKNVGKKFIPSKFRNIAIQSRVQSSAITSLGCCGVILQTPSGFFHLPHYLLGGNQRWNYRAASSYCSKDHLARRDERRTTLAWQPRPSSANELINFLTDSLLFINITGWMMQIHFRGTSSQTYNELMLEKFSKCKVEAAWCGNFTILLPLKFYVKSNFFLNWNGQKCYRQF